MSRTGYGQNNKEPQKWLMMGLYPLALLVVFLGVAVLGWLPEPEESKPVVYEDSDITDVGDILDKLGISDYIDPIIPTDLDDYKKIVSDFTGEDFGDSDGNGIISNIIDKIGIGGDSEDAGDDSEKTKDQVEEKIDQAENVDTSSVTEVMNWLEGSDFYYYSTLNDSEKFLYAELYSIYSNIADFTVVSTDDPDMIQRIHTLVCGDHPELFYVAGHWWSQGVNGTAVTGIYEYADDQILSNQVLNEEAVNIILGNMPAGMTEYEMVKYIYNYIIDNTEYRLNCEWNQEYSSVFINHVSVCAGYSRAMQYLLQKCGIQTMYVTGDAGGPHAWLITRVDGKYYYLDVTWGDYENKEVPYYDYSYLNIPFSRIVANHTVDEVYPVPACESLEASYYMTEGGFVTELDDNTLYEIFETSKLENDGVVYLMAADSRIYNALLKYLFDEGKVYDFYFAGQNDYSGVNYYHNAEINTITIYKR